jgi:hypothetical protein
VGEGLASVRQMLGRLVRQTGWLAATAVLTLWSSAAHADESFLDALPFDVHGFVSQGFIKSAENDYLAKSKRGSFEFSEVGLNVTKQITSELRAGMQFFAHDLGPTGNYQPQADWFYADYRFRDWVGIRIGRIKVPFGLYNELNDIDAARAPVLLPQSIYPTDHREFAFAQTGGELYGNVPLPGLGSLEYRLYGGTLSGSPGSSPPPPGITVSNVEMPYVVGGRVLWETPLEGLQAAFSLQQLQLDADYTLSPELLAFFKAVSFVPADLVVPTPVKFKVTRWVGSLSYSAHDLDLTLEYSRWLGEFDSRMPVLLPPHILNERYYAMASYRVTSWFTPSIYYSAYYPNILKRHQHAAYQHDLAVSARYDLTPNWLFKVEGHYMRGTAYLDNRGLNGGVEAKDLEPNWALFMIKSTVYF